MDNFCKDIELKIVDYIENLLDDVQKEEFIRHINSCEICRKKFDGVSEVRNSLIVKGYNTEHSEISKERLFIALTDTKKMNDIILRTAVVVVSLIVIVISVFIFSHISFRYKVEEAKQIEISSEYIVDLEEEVIATEDETFEVLSAILYGDEYKYFEEVLDETSIFKP